ncbi:TolC family outer membrane protein [Nordella sp. HKS 07]|uniref:TolC family outer membrane protein n=1 Tax=Nordella sp. HKS 07 TaxID=2712222 RepID=UPI0013E13BAA|nr:TolC family outer membrane protein [Nordella sp. HKS 07]QIG51537.1 TolC family outer membrane protein [Nordella sp. HKS 07]
MTANAENLSEALASAYSGNPTLRAERARQRATDEATPQALSGWRPTVDAQASSGFVDTLQKPNPGEWESRRPGDLAITLSQPIFRGFKTVEGVKQAEAVVEAGRQNLLAVEQQTLFDAVTAYMNVIRDRRVLQLRQRNVKTLQEQLRSTQERFNVGEVTKTDVSQAQAQLALSQSTVAAAKSNLASSVANYNRVVGHSPGTLKYPKLPKLPSNLDAALVLAENINPNILNAAFVAEAARHNVGVVRGDLLPSVNLQASGTKTVDDLDHFADNNTQRLALIGSINVPLYEAGSVYSAVREAKQVESQRRIEIISAARAVRESVVTSWNLLIAARETIVSSQAQVTANQVALDGVKQENLVGSRTTLDVLNAESDLLQSEIILAQAERDQVVAAYQILGSVGRLTARQIGLGVDYYDPIENYDRVRNKWFGTGVKTID